LILCSDKDARRSARFSFVRGQNISASLRGPWARDDAVAKEAAYATIST
jgi:hypothetical protein